MSNYMPYYYQNETSARDAPPPPLLLSANISVLRSTFNCNPSKDVDNFFERCKSTRKECVSVHPSTRYFLRLQKSLPVLIQIYLQFWLFWENSKHGQEKLDTTNASTASEQCVFQPGNGSRWFVTHKLVNFWLFPLLTARFAYWERTSPEETILDTRKSSNANMLILCTHQQHNNLLFNSLWLLICLGLILRFNRRSSILWRASLLGLLSSLSSCFRFRRKKPHNELKKRRFNLH